MRTILLTLLLAVPLQAQLQVLYGGVALRALVDLGSAPSGDVRSSTFTLHNIGTTPLKITTISVLGSGFSIAPAISLPFSLAAGQSQNVTVRFQAAAPGKYSASVILNDWSTLLLATVSEGLVLVDVTGMARSILSADALVEFGASPAGRISQRDFSLENPGSQSLALPPISIRGEGFQLIFAMPAPTAIAAAGAVPFRIEATSDAAADRSAMLIVGNRQVALTAKFIDPMLPIGRFVVNSAALRSGNQAAISIVFDQDPPADATGNLSLSLLTNSLGFDQAIQFLPSGKQSISFEVRKGMRSAQFGSSSSVILQTGTTAWSGTLSFRVANRSDYLPISLAPMGIQIDSARAVRAPSTLEVVISGFDNTRTAGREVFFTFYDRNDVALPEGAYSKGLLQDQFQSLFAQSKAGGIFELKAVFPFTGDPSAISAVSVQMANSIAITKTDRIKLQ